MHLDFEYAEVVLWWNSKPGRGEEKKDKRLAVDVIVDYKLYLSSCKDRAVYKNNCKTCVAGRRH